MKYYHIETRTTTVHSYNSGDPSRSVPAIYRNPMYYVMAEIGASVMPGG